LNSTTSTDVQNACDSYTWIDGNTYTSSNNTATWTISNSVGCDSVISLDLSIDTLSIETSVSNLTISSEASGANYQWLDCNDGMGIIPGETDQSFTVTENGSYAVTVAFNSCIDTSDCVVISNVGIIENEISSSFKIYPNPTNGMITINFENSQEEINARLLTISGKVIENKSIRHKNKFEMIINEAPGIYLLELSDFTGAKALIRIVKK
jgi:hypothetical protein